MPPPDTRSEVPLGERQLIIGSETTSDADSRDRVFELILRLFNRVDQPTLPEDILCSVGSYWRTGKGALLLNDGWDGADRVATSIGLSPDTVASLNGEVGRQLLAAAFREPHSTSLRQLSVELGSAGFADVLVPWKDYEGRVIPLVTLDGSRVGAILLFLEAEPDLDLAEEFAFVGPLLAQLIRYGRDNFGLRQEAIRFRARAHLLHSVAEACTSLTAQTEELALLKRAASIATTFVAEGCGIDMVTSTGELVQVVARCRASQHRRKGTCCIPSERIRSLAVQQVLRTRQPVIVEDASAAQLEIPDALEHPEQWSGEAGTTILYLPVSAGGRVVGALTLVTRDLGGDADDHLLLGTEIARHTTIALDHLRRMESARQTES